MTAADTRPFLTPPIEMNIARGGDALLGRNGEQEILGDESKDNRL